ncbi:MAG: ABC transporter permease, partial [Phycisphaerales bacterium]
MTALWQDVRYAMRMLARNPGFSAAVVVILALGIGANTAIFSVANAVLFRPWPCVEPERIVSVWEQDKSQDTVRFGSSARNIAYWREHSAAFEYVGVCQNFHACLTGIDRPRYLDGSAVSPSFFRIMGVQPLLGRDFPPEEELAGHENVVILSHALWVERFASDREAIGKTLSLDNKEYTVLGVMPGDLPRAMTFGSPFWVPVALKPDETGSGGSTFARLNRGVTVEQTRANLGVLMEQLAEIDPRMVRGNAVHVERLLDRAIGGYRVELYLLWGAAALVLLVACANAACLFLGHASVREREIAVRGMLGASRTRLVRQLLVQGMALSAIAAGMGILMGAWTLKGLLWICPAYMPRIDESRVDASVLILALGLVTFTGVLFSLIPAWRVSDVRLCQATKARAAGLSTRSREGRLQGTMIVAQIAVALTL